MRDLDRNGYGHIEIEVDGNVSFENVRLMSEAGTNIFVAGTSSIFKKDLLLEEAIAKFQKAIGHADTEEDVRKCVTYGCDNITGNDPAVALNTLCKIGLH